MFEFNIVFNFNSFLNFDFQIIQNYWQLRSHYTLLLFNDLVSMILNLIEMIEVCYWYEINANEWICLKMMLLIDFVLVMIRFVFYLIAHSFCLFRRDLMIFVFEKSIKRHVNSHIRLFYIIKYFIERLGWYLKWNLQSSGHFLHKSNDQKDYHTLLLNYPSEILDYNMFATIECRKREKLSKIF